MKPIILQSLPQRLQLVQVVVGGALGVALLIGWPAISVADEPTPGPEQGQKAQPDDPSQVKERATGQGGLGGFGYTCSDTIEGRTCSCEGYADCQNLIKSQKCCKANEGGGCTTTL